MTNIYRICPPNDLCNELDNFIRNCHGRNDLPVYREVFTLSNFTETKWSPSGALLPWRHKNERRKAYHCPPLLRKHGDIKSHSSVCLSGSLYVTKTLTLAITLALLQEELWYLACVFFVTRPFSPSPIFAISRTLNWDFQQSLFCTVCIFSDFKVTHLVKIKLIQTRHVLVKHRCPRRATK